jgi:hypothetical protein
MDRPPSPSGPRTHAKIARSTPSHRTANPRGTSGSCQPPSYAAAVTTPPRAGYYDLLCAAMGHEDDNLFQLDSDDKDADVIASRSLILLTNPAGIAVMVADTAEVVDAPGPGVATGNAPGTVAGATTATPHPVSIPPGLMLPY